MSISGTGTYVKAAAGPQTSLPADFDCRASSIPVPTDEVDSPVGRQPGSITDGAASQPDVAVDEVIRVTIAYSAQLLAHGINALLRTDPRIELLGALPVHGPRPALEQQAPPDIVLVECLFATSDRARLVRGLGDEFPSSRMLVVCGVLNDRELSEVVAAGAYGYLTPDCGHEDLVDAIRRVSRREALLPPSTFRRLFEPQARSDGANPPPPDTAVSIADEPNPLAPRERQVLEAMATGLSTEEVADFLGITVHTVRTHLQHILLKLNVHSKLQAVIVGLRKGWIEFPR